MSYSRPFQNRSPFPKQIWYSFKARLVHLKTIQQLACEARARKPAQSSRTSANNKSFADFVSIRALVISIECFHSRGQHLCKFIGTKGSVCMRKELNSQRIGLGHQHGRRFIVLGHQYGRRDVMWKHSFEKIAQGAEELLCPWLQLNFSAYIAIRLC